MKEVYQERLDRFTQAWQEEDARSHRLGWVRVAVFCSGFLFYLGMDVGSGTPARIFAAGLGLFSLAFFGLVIRHWRVRRRREWCRTMAEINETALARMARRWDGLSPVSFQEPDLHHPYAYDLDISGDASLFRLFTTVTLPPGFETLRAWVLEPALPREVVRRQKAVEELSSKVDFRQELEAQGRLLESPPSEALRDFLAWAESDGWLSEKRWVLWVARLFPLLSATLFVMNWGGSLEGPWWLLSLGAALGFGSFFQRRIHPLMERASAGRDRFGRYASTLGLLLRTEVHAPALRELQAAIRSGPLGAEQELQRLGRRLGWADIRHSAMAHAPLQALLVWDVHMMAGLEKWKARSGGHVRDWLGALGEVEALSALAALRGDHPDWCFPEFTEEGEPRLVAKGLGHPLLPQGVCVRNDLEIGPPGTFLFVTGSNMSGKSTLLRAVGINAVLAQAGGPVCAESMKLAPLRVQTSMRTSDSLSEGVSQYMAELNRIRQVVGAAREDAERGILFLLDEPLQGTNEAERRVAVQTILEHLLHTSAIGAVATHDLLLDDSDFLRPAARAVHLEGSVSEVAGPLLTFDYLLKPGRATSTNALALLRAVGLGQGSIGGA